MLDLEPRNFNPGGDSMHRVKQDQEWKRDVLENLENLSREGCDLPGETDMLRRGDEPLNMEGSLQAILADGVPISSEGWGTVMA
jgi:hypothetical protein